MVNTYYRNTGNKPELSYTNYQHFTSHMDQYWDLIYQIYIPVSSLAKIKPLFERIGFFIQYLCGRSINAGYIYRRKTSLED